MGLLSELRSAGLLLKVRGNQLLVEPKATLTDPLRAAIRANKADIMRELASVETAESEVGLSPQSPVQESARREVLSQLEAHPTIQRAMVNRFEDGNLIVTLAIRGVGTGELLIPAEQFNSGRLDDYAALLECLGAETVT